MRLAAGGWRPIADRQSQGSPILAGSRSSRTYVLPAQGVPRAARRVGPRAVLRAGRRRADPPSGTEHGRVRPAWSAGSGTCWPRRSGAGCDTATTRGRGASWPARSGGRWAGSPTGSPSSACCGSCGAARRPSWCTRRTSPRARRWRWSSASCGATAIVTARWLCVDLALFVALGRLAIVPGPNLIAYYFAFRVVGHYFSVRGARQGLERVAWRSEPSTILSDLRRALALDPPLRHRRVHDIAAALDLPHLVTVRRARRVQGRVICSAAP